MIHTGIVIVFSGEKHTKKKKRLQAWLDDKLLYRFKDLILSIDTETMILWGGMVAELKKSGVALPIMDSLIAHNAKDIIFV